MSQYFRSLRNSEYSEVQWLSQEDILKSLIYLYTWQVIQLCYWGVRALPLRVGWFKRTASKHVYYLGWNRSPAQVGCMRQALGPGTLGRPRGIGWRGRWERGSGWGTHVNPWLFHFNVWQNSLQKKKKKRALPFLSQRRYGNFSENTHTHTQ